MDVCSQAVHPASYTSLLMATSFRRHGHSSYGRTRPARRAHEHGRAARVPARQILPAQHDQRRRRPAGRRRGGRGRARWRRPGRHPPPGRSAAGAAPGPGAPVAGGAFVPGAVAQAATPTQTFASAESVDGALVAPFGRHLAYGNDARTEMTVSWQVPVAVKKPFIRIRTRPRDLSRQIDAEVRPLYTPAGVGASGDHTQYYLHAKLSRLPPGQTYYYGVGHQGFDPAEPHPTGTP